MHTKIKLSIIIVHYKVKKELFACLQSLLRSHVNFDYEILVVDNDEIKSIDKEIKKVFPQVIYIKSPANIGFGAGNNIGAKQARGEYLFFLNPDTIVFENALNELVMFLDKNKQAGITAPLLLDHNNKPYPLQGTNELTPLRGIIALSFFNKLFPNNVISKRYWDVDWDKNTVRKFDVIPGTAFVIRKKIFEKIGKFDEHFFMYFEESDLCNRVKKLGYAIYILPTAKVYHAWGSSTKKSDKNINKIFSQSQFYYFKKNYGLLSAWAVKLFSEFGKKQLLFLLILALGIFLRVYQIEQNFQFDGEIGDNLLDIKNAFLHKQIPLKGPPTSHPWLSFGPLFYWLYGPILILAKFNPISHAYFGLAISILIIIFNYNFIKKIFSSSVAIFSSFLIAISPLYLLTGRSGRFTFIVSLFIYPFLWMIKKIADGEKKYFFWLCFLLGLMLNFHYTPLVLIPFILTMFYTKKIKFSLTEHFIGFLGLLLPLVPILSYDAMHKFSMVRNLLLWIPYRILGFLGLYHKNTFTQSVFREDTFSFVNFFSYSFIPAQGKSYALIGLCITVLLICFTLWELIQTIRRKTLKFTWLLLFGWGFWMFLAVFIHGSPPLHYFVPILPFPILLCSLLLEKFWSVKHMNGKLFVVVFLLIVSTINLRYYFSDNWFYIRGNKTPYTDGYISYDTHKKIAQFIVKDAQGEHFRLQRVGYNDIFEKQFAQNYIYLLWYYGNEPSAKAQITYTIVEDGYRISQVKTKYAKAFIVDNVIILKNRDHL